jgi:hypothetical protein
VEDSVQQVRLSADKLTISGRQKAQQLLNQGQALVADQLENVSQAAQAGKKAIEASWGWKMIISYWSHLIHILYEKEITMHITKNIGFLLLAIWLILTGLAAFIPAVAGLGVVMSILAIAAGVFILLGR